MPFGCFIGDGEAACAWRHSPVVSGHLFVDCSALEDAAGELGCSGIYRLCGHEVPAEVCRPSACRLHPPNVSSPLNHTCSGAAA